MDQPLPAPRDDDARTPQTVKGPLPPLPKRKAALIAGALVGSALAGMLTRDAPGQRPGPGEDERRQPQAGGRGTRSLAIVPDSYDEAAHTVEAVLSAGTAVQRYYFVEELEISDEAIDLGRVDRGVCPLLDTHNQYETNAQIGRVVSARIEDGQLIGTIEFDQTDHAKVVEGRVARGELRALSIGYRVTTWQITSTPGDASELDTWRATAWELLEASFVPVPADPNAVVRSAPQTPPTVSQEEEDMRRNLPGAVGAAPALAAATAPAVEPTRQTPTTEASLDQRAAPTIAASRIIELCGRSAHLDANFQNELIRDSEAGTLTEATMQQRIADRVIEASARPSVDVRAAPRDEDDAAYRNAVADALILRANPRDLLNDDVDRPAAGRIAAARDFRGMTLMELARHHLERDGVSTRGMGRLQIAGEALGLRYGGQTTSDFANALSYATQRQVRRAFEASPQTFRPFITTGTLPDFKPAQIVGLGDAPALLLVPEMGEFKRGALSDTGQSYRLQTYGRVIAISRQAIVNDDKDLFGRIPTMFGRKAADLESDLIYGLLLSNPNMADGNPVFSVALGTQAAVGGAISVATVSAGETAMLQQKNDDGGFINVRPEYLIVGPAKKVEAETFLTAVTAAKTADVNPYPGTLTLIVDPRVTGNQWFLSASPDAFDTMVLSHLDGQEELFTEQRVGFDVDGVETKARLDVGGAFIDRRGFYRNPGN